MSKSYTLTAWAGTAPNRAVKFTDALSGEVYFLELRLPVGNDAATAVNGNRGVKIVQNGDQHQPVPSSLCRIPGRFPATTAKNTPGKLDKHSPLTLEREYR
ncbi:hypothetical protein ACW0JT_11850 [Arthrobacter sp. SA17]